VIEIDREFREFWGQKKWLTRTIAEIVQIAENHFYLFCSELAKPLTGR
jgi:hypothetical protein